ncbi:MAG: hypothetical protein R3E32_11840 [Chitinophagales bacterium]
MNRDLQKLLIPILCIFLLSSSCAYKRIGDLTQISSRNIDSAQDYQLIQRYVKGVSKVSNGNPLEQAVEVAVKSIEGGEYLQNVKVFVKGNGKKVKVEGDVWGIPTAAMVEKAVTQSVKADITFEVGDKVAFKRQIKVVTGKIVGIGVDKATVSISNGKGKEVNYQVLYEKLTKLE